MNVRDFNAFLLGLNDHELFVALLRVREYSVIRTSIFGDDRDKYLFLVTLDQFENSSQLGLTHSAR